MIITVSVVPTGLGSPRVCKLTSYDEPSGGESSNVPPWPLSLFHCLENLASGLYTRIKQQAVLSDLEESIELPRAVLLLRSSGNSG